MSSIGHIQQFEYSAKGEGFARERERKKERGREKKREGGGEGKKDRIFSF